MKMALKYDLTIIGDDSAGGAKPGMPGSAKPSGTGVI